MHRDILTFEAPAISWRQTGLGLLARVVRAVTVAAAAVVTLTTLAAAQEPGSFPVPNVTVRPGQPPEPLPIAISDFHGQGNLEKLGRDMRGVIAANLDRSGLFRVIDQKAYLQRPADLLGTPRFADWRVIQAPALVTGSITPEGGQLKVEFRLWDIFNERQMVGLAYVTQQDNWRRIAHIISDAVYKELTGEDGYFDTRVVYIAEDGAATNRRKRLAIMDQDGFNHQYLTDGRVGVVTPRFSPTSQEITYMTLGREGPQVYLFNLDTGRQEPLGRFNGMTFAPRFAPDGRSVVISVENGGNTDIYSIDLASRSQRRLTDSPFIDTSPSYSPDGREIVFESDRSGTQQIYIMDAGGGGVRRISGGDGRYATPVWSPRGDLIAFTKLQGGQFHIGVMRPDGSGERILDSAYHVEGPTWAPNGRVLMYFRETPSNGGRDRDTRMYSVDLTGMNRRLVETPGQASDPAWSALLQ